MVLLDLVLPGTDGIDLMKDIAETRDVPVIFLSAYGQDKLVARAFDMGAADYMVKPFSPTELLARIKAALRRREVPSVKGGEKVYHCGGGIVYHRHDEKGLNWEPGGIRSGAGVRSSGVSQESTGSSDTWEAALCRLCLRR